MGIELYYLPLSAPCRSVMLLAKELGIDLELKRVELFQGEHMKPEFLALNPQHAIPTMNDNGYVLAESRAILQYLVNQYGKDESLYPTDPKQRGIVDHRLNWDLGTFLPRLREYFYPVVFKGQENFSSEAKERLEEAVAWLDGFIEKSGGWVAGPNKTIADYSILAVFSNIELLPGPHAIDMSKYKNVTEWFAKCKAEMKGYEEAMHDGAVQWIEFFKSKSEGKGIK